MNILEMIIMIVLIIIILGGVAIPDNIHAAIGSVPGIIIILCVVFYLFTVSPILGVFAMIAGYEIVVNTNMNRSSIPVLDQLPDQGQFTETNQFETTLEENIVKNIVPLVQTTSPTHLNFKYTEDPTYSAANIVNVPK